MTLSTSIAASSFPRSRGVSIFWETIRLKGDFIDVRLNESSLARFRGTGKDWKTLTFRRGMMLLVVGVLSPNSQSLELGVRGISQGRGTVTLLGVSYAVLMDFVAFVSCSKYERQRILGVRFGMFGSWDATIDTTILSLDA